MCTGVVDHQKCIPAIQKANTIHQDVPVRMAGGEIVTCRGGMNAPKVNDLLQDHLPDYFTHTYLNFLPEVYSHFDMRNTERSVIELRYTNYVVWFFPNF